MGRKKNIFGSNRDRTVMGQLSACKIPQNSYKFQDISHLGRGRKKTCMYMSKNVNSPFNYVKKI